MISTLAHLNRLLEGMVHGSVQDDRLLMLRHRQSLATHLATGLAGLAAIPVWLTVGGLTSIADATVLAWLVAPLALAFWLSRTGELCTAYLLAAIAGAGFMASLACLTGGLRSPILFCLALLPIEASLSGSRMVAAAGMVAAATGLAAIALAETAGLSTIAVPGIDAALLAAAIIYVGGIVFRLQGLVRDASGCARQDEERYRLLADHATDMITRHGANGDVDFASPGARRLTGDAIGDLLGNGFFRRVHVADRPAYLKALSDARSSRRETVAELRLRRTRPGGEADDFIQVVMRCRPTIGPDGIVGGVIAVTRDFGDQAEAEREPATPPNATSPIRMPVNLAPTAAKTPRSRDLSEPTAYQPQERKSA